MFRFLSIHREGPDYIDVEAMEPRPPRGSSMACRYGQKILSQFPDFSFTLRTVSARPPLAHWIVWGSFSIVADPLREIIEQNTDEEIEWIPIHVLRPKSIAGPMISWPESYRFSIMNVLGLVDCIDEEASVFSEKRAIRNTGVLFY